MSDSIIEVHLENLKPGMKLSKNIQTKFGAVLLSAGKILTVEDINKLYTLDKNYFKIVSENDSKIKNNLYEVMNIKVEYNRKINQFKKLFKKIKYNNQIEKSEIEKLTQETIGLAENMEVLDVLKMVKKTDEYTYYHLLNVGILAKMFSDWLNLNSQNTKELTMAGTLIDIGKIKVPDDILKKPGKLTEQEYKTMQKHAKYSYNIVKKADFISENTVSGILTHHEKYNGTGYPLGLKGKEIPYFGRILSIIDSFDAMTSDKIYNPASSPFEAFKMFKEDKNEVYDYELKEIFIKNIPNLFIKEKIRLNDGRIAEIRFINPNQPDRPIIQIEDEFIDLRYNKSIYIEEVIN